MNDDVSLDLDEAVGEVLGILTGMDLHYRPDLDRYRAITRALNQALRANALDNEWSFYHSMEDIGTVTAGDQEFAIRPKIRPRIINDDSVRLVDENGQPRAFAAFLPRDALSKYSFKKELRVAALRSTIRFSRPLEYEFEGLHVEVPVQREPIMFRLPKEDDDPLSGDSHVPESIREQPIDFDYPDVVIMRAAYFYAQSDPVMQPRTQTLEAMYKTLMYALIERDTRMTDSPEQNDFFLPLEGLDGASSYGHLHQHASEL